MMTSATVKSIAIHAKQASTSTSTSSGSPDLSNRLSRAATPNLLPPTQKRYKAPLSAESRNKNFTKTKSVLAPVSGSPARRDGSTSRPRTPASPSKGAESPSLMPATSEMDVSNVDPEQVLVDYQTIEEAEISGEIDEAWLQAAMLDHGTQDKVMVSIR
jgi:centromeric protein E